VGEDLLETPGEGEMSGEARFFIHPGSHKNGGMARVSAPLAAIIIGQPHVCEVIPFSLQSGVEVRPKGFGTRRLFAVDCVCCTK
jgi:hypothetical protein